MGFCDETPSPTDAPGDARWEDGVVEEMDRSQEKQMKKRRPKYGKTEEKKRMVVQGMAKKGLKVEFSANGVSILP